MKRFWIRIFTIAILVSLLAIPARADNTASRVQSYCTVQATGDCQITLTINLRLDTPMESVIFPLPLEATDISMNGSGVRTNKTDTAIEVDMTRAAGNMVGEISVRLDYTVPDVIKVTPERQLQLELPMLSGFGLPVDSLDAVVMLPGNITLNPRFHSTYRQSAIDSALDFVVNGNMITIASNTQLNDHEAVSMTLMVPQEMFPTISVYLREGNPEVIPMLILIGVAMLYWLIFLRTLPLIRKRSVSPLQGLTAGELGSHLTLAGADLTMMVMSWAQLGYIMIQLDERGRVLLHKRMDMGNERSPFENKVFRLLFGQRMVVDATGAAYAKLCLKVARSVPGEKSMNRPSSGNMKFFRWICCASHVFCGICVAMNMTAISVLQILLSIILGIVGAVSAWLIQEVAYRTHIRGKVPVYIGLVAFLIWVVLGIVCGQWVIPLCSVLGQWVLGYFAAYGGLRSDNGRQDACAILGLRRYMKKVTKEELDRIMAYDPEYFFHMAPYALALGVINPFAKCFAGKKLDPCPYMISGVRERRSAAEWASILAATADRLDERQRRMQVEKWSAIRFR